ncbi:uncharacterized protein LOC110242971 isoform X2 [Exaiptasia diaphana]|uniref:Uncharacterized protein n=1 Tax=Exaiptasia diaphana TaxID=2652724 RepID=A0A913YLQ4_EXADI|nr:uncharacterized protein LOC110242971 isoform X2 [Exaiptasia diaphana]
MFLSSLSSLEIGLLAGGAAILLAVIFVLVILLCRQKRENKKSQAKSPRQKRRLQHAGHHHSTIDLPPLVYMDGIGASKTNIMGMIENPLNSFPTADNTMGSQGSTLRSPEWKSFDSLGVPRSPREFMYYMRNLEHSRSNSPATPRRLSDNNSESDSGIYDIKMFSPSYKDSKSKTTGSEGKTSRNERKASSGSERKTSGALRHPAYREMMQGNSFHVVCTTPCTDMSDSDSEPEPEISSPKARLKFTTIMEEHGGSTSSALNIISRTEMPPTYQESKQARLKLPIIDLDEKL